jgi:hypothetical protein
MKPRRWPPIGDEALLHQAHDDSVNHRAEVLASSRRGCFYCLAVYEPSDIDWWIDDDPHGTGQTALCPKCSVDSALGDKSGCPLTKEFLAKLHAHWFGA